MNDPKVVLVEIMWNDGRIERAEGEDAGRIWKAIHETIPNISMMKVVREPLRFKHDGS